jgi:hypothetical protein
VLHAVIIAAACSAAPVFVAVLWASDVRAARKEQPPEREDAEPVLKLAA